MVFLELPTVLSVGKGEKHAVVDPSVNVLETFSYENCPFDDGFRLSL